MKLDKISSKGSENLYRSPKTGIIYFRQYKAGREVFKSTRAKELSAARKIADEFRLSLLQGKDAKSIKLRPVALELFDKWLQRKETLGSSHNTITSINASRKFFEDYFRYMTIDQITAEWWESEYIPQVKEKTGNFGRKFFNDRKWLIAFLRQIKDDGHLSAMPTIRKIDKPTKVGKVYTDDEVSTLLNFAQNSDLRLAILMAVTMGMRRSEIFLLACSRVDLKTRVINLSADDTKTKRARSFAISNDCWPLINARCAHGNKWVFPRKFFPSQPLHLDGFKTAWTNLRRSTGIKGRFHDLRHTFLTKAFKTSGVNPALICYYAGLSMEVAERVYLHFDAADTKGMRSIVSYSEQTPSDEASSE